MKNKSLIIIEGPDGLGKTQLAKQLALDFGSKLVHNSPSRTNSASFLRDITRSDKNLSPFERQLLHTISNLTDFYEEFSNPDTGRTHVLDRCFLSTMIYAIADGVDMEKVSLIQKIHNELMDRWVEKTFTNMIILVRDQPFKKPDDSYHEQNIKWEVLRDLYRSVGNQSEHELGAMMLGTDDKVFLDMSFQKTLIEVGDKSPEEVLEEARRFLGWYS